MNNPTTTYTPSYSASLHQCMTDRVRRELDAAAAEFGCYPWSNRELSAAAGVTMTQLVAILQYLVRRDEWVPCYVPVDLLKDPRGDGRALRRGTVLVRGGRDLGART